MAKAPQRECKKCGALNHVRCKACRECGQTFVAKIKRDDTEPTHPGEQANPLMGLLPETYKSYVGIRNIVDEPSFTTAISVATDNFDVEDIRYWAEAVRLQGIRQRDEFLTNKCLKVIMWSNVIPLDDANKQRACDLIDLGVQDCLTIK